MLIKTYSLEEFNQAKLTQGTIDVVLFNTLTNRKIKTFTRNEFENDFYHSDIANFRYNDDRIWGVGLSEEDERIHNSEIWRGLNLLGKILDEVRGELI